MFELKDINIELIRKILPNVVTLIPSVSLIYLFLTTRAQYAFWLSCVALFILALQINFDERFMRLILLKIRRIKNPQKKGLHIIMFLLKDPAYMILTLLSFIFAIVTFILLYMSPKDAIVWTFIFLCLLAGFYYITIPIVYVYSALKYPKLIDTLGGYILKTSKAITNKKKSSHNALKRK